MRLSQAPTSSRPNTLPLGEMRFVSSAEVPDLCTGLGAQRFLVVGASAGPLAPAGLRRRIDDAVEGELAARGALPAAIGVDAELSSCIRDQVFRTRALGSTGLAIALPPLSEMTDPEGRLNVDDSAALLAWTRATAELPVVLLASEADRRVSAYAPMPLERLLATEGRAAPAAVSPAREEARLREEGRGRTPPAGEAAPRVDVAVVTRAPEQEAPRRLKAGILKGVKKGPRPEERPVEARAPRVAGDEHDDETATLPVLRARDTGAARAVTSAEWRNLAVELDAARGPKPVRVIEQLFMTRYVPLVGALARGEADGAVRGIVDGWGQAFEQSYTDAFAAMRVTGKRPMMTFDAPEIATRIARLNGARGVKLLLVDGMSFDLGERVAAELRARATASGVCVDRLLLWSALPTTTPMQVALLSKGPDALRDVEPPSEPEHEIARGRAVGTLRRERAGARELMKLDLVEARLRTAGPAYEDRLDTLADEVTAVLARYLESLPPRTLLFIFGDHGFRLPRSADGRSTGPATQGGASPEEVLVPAYAWLSGGVH
jgi:hypothetical protein